MCIGLQQAVSNVKEYHESIKKIMSTKNRAIFIAGETHLGFLCFIGEQLFEIAAITCEFVHIFNIQQNISLARL